MTYNSIKIWVGSRHGNGARICGACLGPVLILTGKIRVDQGRVGVRFSPIVKFGFGIGDEILNIRSESVPESAPLIINIYNILKYEIISLNFMFYLKLYFFIL